MSGYFLFHVVYANNCLLIAEKCQCCSWYVQGYWLERVSLLEKLLDQLGHSVVHAGSHLFSKYNLRYLHSFCDGTWQCIQKGFNTSCGHITYNFPPHHMLCGGSFLNRNLLF